MTNMCADVLVRSQEGLEEAARPLVRGGNADGDEIVVFNTYSATVCGEAELLVSADALI
jgi:hypothetical protein